jgi:hypothetical protein
MADTGVPGTAGSMKTQTWRPVEGHGGHLERQKQHELFEQVVLKAPELGDRHASERTVVIQRRQSS